MEIKLDELRFRELKFQGLVIDGSFSMKVSNVVGKNNSPYQEIQFF